MGEIIEESTIGVSGHLKIDITNPITGRNDSYKFDNKVLNTYLSRLAQWSAGINNVGQNPAYPASKFQMGTGAGVPAVTDPSLFVTVAGSLIQIATVTFSANQTIFTINYPANYILGTFTEAGLKDVNGVLLTHIMLSPSIQINSGDIISLTYTITFAAS